MTKVHTPIFLAAVLLSVQACDQRPTSTIANPTSTPAGTSSPKAPDLQSQALEAAEKEWSKVWVKEGDTWIAGKKDRRYLLQIRGRRVEASADALSEADRLNGVQWAGSVAFHCVAARKFGFVSDSAPLTSLTDPNAKHNAGWNEWYVPEGAMAVYRFKKQRDAWTQEKGGNEFLALAAGLDEMERPTAAQLQQSQPTH